MQLCSFTITTTAFTQTFKVSTPERVPQPVRPLPVIDFAIDRDACRLNDIW